MKIVFFGTPSFVIPVLEALINNFDVVGVVTTPDVPVGRKKNNTPTPVKKYALDHKIAVFELEQLAKDQRLTTKDQPDIFVVAAYGHLIPEHVLKIPKLGAFNIHPSLLPKYRGPSPIQMAILNADNETGTTIIHMDKELDHGPIVIQKTIQLKGDETFESLRTLLFQLAAAILPTTMQQWTDATIKVILQDEMQATYCKKITKEDGYFDPNNPPAKEKLDRMIRAYYPWPTAWTKVRIKNQEVRMKFLPKRMIQLEGGKAMTDKDFLNGYPQLKDLLEKLFG